MNTNDWAEIGIFFGALIAFGTVAGWTYRRVIRPMWKRTARSLRRLNRGMDDLLGKPAEYDDEGRLLVPGVTSLRSEMVALRGELSELRGEAAAIRADLNTHVQWHPSPSGRPSGGQISKRRRNGAPDEIA